jgi:iron complex transport system substrate-binding protein
MSLTRTRVLILLAIVLLVTGVAISYVTNRPGVNPTEVSVRYPITIVDDLGRNVTIVRPPQRIVSLIPSATQIVFVVGAGDRVVGVTRYDDYPPELVDRVRNGTIANVGGGLDPDVEKIVQLQPDLILVDGPGHVASQTLQKLQGLGYLTIALNAKSVEGVLHDIRLVGTILGYNVNAQNVVSDIEATVDHVREMTRNATRPTVYIENWHDPLITAGNGTLQNEMVEVAGGVNIFADLVGYQVSSEAVIARNPNIITSFDSLETVAQIISRPGWADINAVKQNRVYQVSPEEGAPNPRIGQSILHLAKLIHPELFSQQTPTNQLTVSSILVIRTRD